MKAFWGGEYYTFCGELFFSILPILAVIPYGLSCFDDRKNGYAKMIITRTGYRKYCVSKLITSFVAGGCAGIFPYILSFLIATQIYPLNYPNVLSWDSFIIERSLLSGYYYIHPFLYCIAFMWILFMVAGILSMLASIASYYLNVRLANLFLPYIVYCLQDVIFERLGIAKWAFKTLTFQAKNCGDLMDISYGQVMIYLLLHVVAIGGLFLWKTQRIETTTLS